jgi:hypothetical protein
MKLKIVRDTIILVVVMIIIWFVKFGGDEDRYDKSNSMEVTNK